MRYTVHGYSGRTIEHRTGHSWARGCQEELAVEAARLPQSNIAFGGMVETETYERRKWEEKRNRKGEDRNEGGEEEKKTRLMERKSKL
jgi:hypothetical protein